MRVGGPQRSMGSGARVLGAEPRRFALSVLRIAFGDFRKTAKFFLRAMQKNKDFSWHGLCSFVSSKELRKENQ
jgi:hypothetical protein